MKYTTYRVTCPSCGKTIDRQTITGDLGDYTRVGYGTPIRKCIFCGHTYVDTRYVEPTCLDNYGNANFNSELKPITTFAIIGSILLAILATILIIFNDTHEKVNYIAGVVFYVLAAVVIIRSYKGQESRRNLVYDYYDSIEASLIRLSDTEYANFIKSHGCTVPLKYSNPTEEDKKELQKEIGKYHSLKMQYKAREKHPTNDKPMLSEEEKLFLSNYRHFDAENKKKVIKIMDEVKANNSKKK